jgi:pimeloyl-ACP methyl ester carboxylesterase
MADTGLDGIDQPAVLDVVFHPRPDGAPEDPRRDVRIPVAEGVSLSGRLHAAADASAPLILFFHGNGEIVSDYDGIAPAYNRLGLAFLVIDYRGYGHSDGTPTVSNLLADARATWDALPGVLAERGLAPARTFAMGRSLGSANALEIGVHAGETLAGLIIESGFAYALELIARLGGPDAGVPDDGRVALGHLAKIERIRVPTLIIHGEDDWIIPVKDAHDLYAHAGAEQKRLVTVPDAGHNDLLWVGMQPYFEAIRAFMAAP